MFGFIKKIFSKKEDAPKNQEPSKEELVEKSITSDVTKEIDKTSDNQVASEKIEIAKEELVEKSITSDVTKEIDKTSDNQVASEKIEIAKEESVEKSITSDVTKEIDKTSDNQVASEKIEIAKEESVEKSITSDVTKEIDKTSDNQVASEKIEIAKEELVEKLKTSDINKETDKNSDNQVVSEKIEIAKEESVENNLNSTENNQSSDYLLRVDESKSFKNSTEIDKKAVIEEIEKFQNETPHLKNEDELEILKAIKQNHLDDNLSYEEKSEKINLIQHDIVEQVEDLIENQLKKSDEEPEKIDVDDNKKSEKLKIVQQDIVEHVETLLESQLAEIKKSEQERTIQYAEGKIILPFPLEVPELIQVYLPLDYKVEFTADDIEEQLNRYVFGNFEEDESLNEISKEEESKSLDNVSEKPKLEEVEKLGWFARLRQGLRRTRELLSKQLSALFSLNRKIDDDLYEELETILLTSDVGIEACTYLMTELQKRVNEQKLETGDQLKEVLKDVLYNLLLPLEDPLDFKTMEEHQPYVIMMVGVNGAGKTTTIGKLAKYFQAQGKSVLLGAGDTFRAAAREQLMVWGERNNVTVVAQDKGDPAAVIFDAIASAKAKKIDIVLADTAGRLATQTHLMAEIQKVKRVINKSDATAPHEIILVLDSNTGQNGLQQVKQFGDALGLTGLILTKLDGTAKGGIIAAIAKNRPIPIRFIGVGEGIDDLRPFTAKDFVDAMFD